MNFHVWLDNFNNFLQLLQEFVERLHDFLCDFWKLRKHKNWNLVSMVDKIGFCFLLCEHKCKSIILILLANWLGIFASWLTSSNQIIWGLSIIPYLIRKGILYERYLNWIIFLAINVRFIKRETYILTRGPYMNWLLAIELKLSYWNR